MIVRQRRVMPKKRLKRGRGEDHEGARSQKKSNVVIEEVKEVETSDSEMESETSSFRQKTQSEACRQVGEVEKLAFT